MKPKIKMFEDLDKLVEPKKDEKKKDNEEDAKDDEMNKDNEENNEALFPTSW